MKQKKKIATLFLISIMAIMLISGLGTISPASAGIKVNLSFIISGSGSVLFQDLTTGFSAVFNDTSLHTYSVDLGDTIRLTATGQYGTIFSHWFTQSVGQVSINPLEFTINYNVPFFLTCNFVIVSEYIVSVIANQTGTSFTIHDLTTNLYGTNQLSFLPDDDLFITTIAPDGWEFAYYIINETQHLGNPIIISNAPAESFTVYVYLTDEPPITDTWNATIYYDETQITLTPPFNATGYVGISTLGFDITPHIGYLVSDILFNGTSQGNETLHFWITQNEDNYNITITSIPDSTYQLLETMYGWVDGYGLNGYRKIILPTVGDNKTYSLQQGTKLGYLFIGYFYSDDLLLSNEYGVYGIYYTGMSADQSIWYDDYTLKQGNIIVTNGTIENGRMSFYLHEWDVYPQTMYSAIKIEWVLTDTGASGNTFYFFKWTIGEESQGNNLNNIDFTMTLFLTVLSLFIAIGFSVIGFALSSKTNNGDPTPALFMFEIGLFVSFLIGWLPSWFFITSFAVLAMFLAIKFARSYTSKGG